MKTPIYLDHNATSPLRPEATAAMTPLRDLPLNASSVHALGRMGRKTIEDARAHVAALTGADPSMVIFNSGATEGNNTILQYFKDARVLVSAIEHPSVLESLTHAVKIPVTPDGIVDLGALENLLRAEKTALVSVMLVNNETGIIQPVLKISSLARQYGALFHIDAVQGMGRIPLSLLEMGADFMTISSHKIGGPQGVGALVLGQCGITPVLLQGGGQEKKARAGTENITAIAGFGAAAQIALSDMVPYNETLSALRGKLEDGLKSIHPAIEIIGENQNRVCNTSFFILPGASSETMMMALDLDGICVSNGSACTSGTVKSSHVLKAMGYSDADSSAAIRVSLGWNTNEGDIEAFLRAFEKIIARLKS